MIREIDWNEQGLIPELLYFENGNDFTGSVNNPGMREYRYRLSPVTEKQADGTEQKYLRAEAWYGPFCYEKSKMEDASDFPLDESGRKSAITWIAEEYKNMLSTPGNE